MRRRIIPTTTSSSCEVAESGSVQPWWIRNPLRGRSLRERRRLRRLSRSGRRIEDPLEAELVHQFVDYMEAFHSSWGWKFIYRVGPWLVIPTLAASVVLSALRTDWFRLAESLVFLIAYVAALLRIQAWRREMDHTARVNGWQ